MQKLKFEYIVTEYDSLEELNNDDQLLLNYAKQALELAYAPYSNYYVGAALKLENGQIFKGNNQENAAYPSGLCAERVAAFSASSQYPDTPIHSIAISAKAKDFVVDLPVTPCGSCRQVFAELQKRHKNSIRFILSGEIGKIYIIEGIENLLPLMFEAENLKKSV